MLTLVNRATGETIASAVEVAETRRMRRRGLLGRSRLDPAAALVLAPCGAIHTAFMRFSIDVVFLDRDDRVVRVVSELPPWRMAWSWRARTVVELAAGTLRSRHVAVGDVVDLVPSHAL